MQISKVNKEGLGRGRKNKEHEKQGSSIIWKTCLQKIDGYGNIQFSEPLSVK